MVLAEPPAEGVVGREVDQSLPPHIPDNSPSDGGPDVTRGDVDFISPPLQLLLKDTEEWTNKMNLTGLTRK